MKRRYILGTIGALSIIGAFVLFYYYQKIWSSNIVLYDGNEKFIFIKTGSNYKDVLTVLKPYLISEDKFKWLSEQKDYPKLVKPGRYRIYNKMSNNELVNMLRGGRQSPLKVTFNNVRIKTDLAAKIGKYLEPDSTDFAKILLSDSAAKNYGFNSATFISMFIPNTYDCKWNTSPQEFLDRMKREYDKFWNEERLAKAKKIGYSPQEIATLASIVQSETNKEDEFRRVAGVYVNRLKQRIPLQADPTLKFALGDFAIKRVLNEHKAVESPYNTYKYAGLPPGPICLPEADCIDSVLEYESHQFLYFCAKEDFSGYSNFAKTLSEHEENARRYQNALNKRKIFR